MYYDKTKKNGHKKARELAPDPDEDKIVLKATMGGKPFRVLARNSHFCAYIGIDSHHRLYKAKYRDIDLDVHGGLTFSGMGDNHHFLEDDIWWLGWDYAHAGDFYYKPPHLAENKFNDRDWTLREVINDSVESLYNKPLTK